MKLIISVVLLLTVGLLASGWRFKGDVGKGLMTLSGTVGGLSRALQVWVGHLW